MTLGKYLFLFAAVATFFSANVSAQTYDITDASWTSMNDQDGDGYTRSRVLHVVISASEPTFGVIRIYIYPAGGTPVVYYDTPGGSLVSAGNSYIDLQIGTSSTGGELDHGAYDIIVQLRSWPTTTTILAQRSGTSNLKNETFETAAQDVQAPLPSPPNLVSPSNGSNQSSTSINFAYQGVSGALEYWLQISRNSGFTDLFFDGSVGNYVIVSVNGFPNIGTVYYWRVRARNSTGWGSYSSAWSFTNGSAPIPVAPNLVSPPNGSYQALREINFAWQGVPGATEYWVQIAEDNSFTNLAYDNSVGNYVIVNISGFENDGKTYYWRARARNSGGWGPYSSTWWFINGSQVTIPVPPVLVAPLNNSMQDLTTINFAYQAVTGATEYWLQIATDNAFTDIVFDNSVGNFVIVALSGFPNDGTIFHWRVRARNSAGWGGYSDPWSFVNGSTPTITAISQQKASAGTNTSITISGSGFGATQGAGRVEFFYKSGNPKIPATVTSWSNTQIVCTVPIGTVGGYAASAGSGPITVTTDAGKTSAGYNFKITFGYGGYKWPGNNPAVSFKINENTPDCNGEGAAIQSAASTWNNAGAAFSFASNGSHTKTTASRNGVNEIMWGNASPYIAVATYWMTGSTMVEADIVFDEAGFTWSTAASPSASAMDVQTIAVHELGHWLCLRDLYGDIGDNDYDKSKVMYGFGSNGIIKRNLHADDVEGIKYIYGIPPVIPPSLSVTPVYRQVSAAAGSTTFSVKNLGGGTLTWTPEVNNTDWVSITSGNAGSNDGTIFVDYMANQGEARIGRIIVRGNAPESPISVEIRQDAPQSPVTHFTPVWSGSPYQAMNIFLESATYAGSPLSSGDEIGVYDGVLCVGAVRLSGAVSPYLEIKTSTDNPLTTPIDGFTSGHTITYKLWRSSSSTEVSNVTVTYNPASPIPTFTPLGTVYASLDFKNSVTQTIAIPEKEWFIFSLNLTPLNTAMQSILQEILPSLVKVQDEDGNAIVKLPNGSWYYGISTWAPTEGYYIYVSSAVALNVTGIPIALPFSTSLTANKWNIISYPSPSLRDALTYFNSLISNNNLSKVQDYQGNAIVKFPNGSWHNGIGNLNPGQGYYVYVPSDGMITTNQTMAKQVNNVSSQGLAFYKSFGVKQKYLPMNIFIMVADKNIKELAAYATNGNFIGAGKVIDDTSMKARYAEIIVSADNPLTEEIDGLRDNEPISFKAWNGDRESGIYPSAIGRENIAFHKMGTLFLEAKEGIMDVEASIPSLRPSNYPNPFNPVTTIEFNLPQDDQISLTVYNGLGEIVDKLLDGEMKASGNYRILWNAKNKSSGHYYYRLQTSRGIFVNKMILIK